MIHFPNNPASINFVFKLSEGVFEQSRSPSAIKKKHNELLRTYKQYITLVSWTGNGGGDPDESVSKKLERAKGAGKDVGRLTDGTIALWKAEGWITLFEDRCVPFNCSSQSETNRYPCRHKEQPNVQRVNEFRSGQISDGGGDDEDEDNASEAQDREARSGGSDSEDVSSVSDGSENDDDHAPLKTHKLDDTSSDDSDIVEVKHAPRTPARKSASTPSSTIKPGLTPSSVVKSGTPSRARKDGHATAKSNASTVVKPTSKSKSKLKLSSPAAKMKDTGVPVPPHKPRPNKKQKVGSDLQAMIADSNELIKSSGKDRQARMELLARREERAEEEYQQRQAREARERELMAKEAVHVQREKKFLRAREILTMENMPEETRALAQKVVNEYLTEL